MSRSDNKFGGKFGADPGGDPLAGQDPFASVPDVDERLADWVDGTMSSRDRERFEAEMRVSPRLREQVADYEATVASIREALNDETHETNLADRVMASLAEETSRPGQRKRSRWPFVWAVMSAAALLGIAILIDSWGGTMLAPKTEAGAAAHLIVLEMDGQEDESTENDSLDVNAQDKGLTAGAPTPMTGEPNFELVENESRSNESQSNEPQSNRAQGNRSQGTNPSDPAKKPSAAKQDGDLQEQKEVAGLGNIDPSLFPAARLANGLTVTGGVNDRQMAKDKAVAGNGAVPSAGAPVSGASLTRSVPLPSKAASPREASPKEAPPGPTGGGSNAGRSSGPTTGGPATGGPATGGPAGPSAPGPTGPTSPGSPGPGRGGSAGGEPGVADRGGRTPGGARKPLTKQRGGAPSAGSEAPASSSVPPETMFRKSVQPKDEAVQPKDSGGPGSEVSRGRFAPDSSSSAGKRRKGRLADDGTRGRELAEGRSLGFLMRLSEETSVGELLPLVTLEGLAIALELPEQAKEPSAAGGRRGARSRAQTGSDDFYLGATRRGQRQMLRRFFDRQMQPAPEWIEPLRRPDNLDASLLRQLAPRELSIGGLQLFAVGPVASSEEAAGPNRAPAETLDPNRVGETKSKSLPRAPKTANPASGTLKTGTPGTGTPGTGTPGEWDANGGAVAQRDWLVVGPKSEVAKLLVALRRYSDDVNSRKCRTGEVRLVKPALQLELRQNARGESAGGDPSGSDPSGSDPSGSDPTGGDPTGSPPAENVPATKPQPAETVSPLPAARVEPTQRVVIRFRVRR